MKVALYASVSSERQDIDLTQMANRSSPGGEQWKS